MLGVKGTTTPLFSTADQILHTNKCVGNLQFLKPVDKSRIFLSPHPDGKTIDVIAPQTKLVVTTQSATDVCTDPTKNFLKVGLRVGGAGPGSVDMLNNSAYAKVGPQFLGTLEKGIGPHGQDVF